MREERAVTDFHFSDKDRQFHNHSHLSCEMIYVKQGRAVFTIQGKSYSAGEGSLIFISSLEEHSVKIAEKPYCRYFLSISSKPLEKHVSNPLLTSIFKNRPENFCHCVPVYEDGEAVERLLLQIEKEYRGGHAFSQEFTCSLLEQLLILLYRRMPSNFPLPPSMTHHRINDIQQYIEQHFSEPLQIRELSKKYFISTDYLTHTFKQVVGYSPKQYLLLNRLTYAQELILQTSLPIWSVALRSGFQDVNNFIRSYKKHFGTTPSRHREAGSPRQGGSSKTGKSPMK